MLVRLIEDQITTLKALQRSYENKKWTILQEHAKDEVIVNFGNEVDRLAKDIDGKIKRLVGTSQDLIQLVNPFVFSSKVAG